MIKTMKSRLVKALGKETSPACPACRSANHLSMPTSIPGVWVSVEGENLTVEEHACHGYREIEIEGQTGTGRAFTFRFPAPEAEETE